MHTLFYALCLVLAMLPFWEPSSNLQQAKDFTFPGWPSTFLGTELRELPISKQEQHFLKGFPGMIGRFTDEEKEILIRWIAKETRKLHPVGDCLLANGYEVTPRPVERDVENRFWGCVTAIKNSSQQVVCEVIFDNNGNSWSDVSSWYWAVVLQRTQGPWWSAVIAYE